MTAPWRAVRVESCSNRDGVLAALFDVGAEGVHEDGAALVTHFPPETDVAPVLAAVHAADPTARVTTADAPVVDWSAWRASVGAHDLGALDVVPPWLADGRDPARTIVIDPAMAFGTGEHPTTRGMIRLMQGVIRAGDVVADLGAGSAVLSIAAIRLGASRVAAIELDPGAESSAVENLERNRVAELVTYLVGDMREVGELPGTFDGVINMWQSLAYFDEATNAEVLRQVRSKLTPGGRFIVDIYNRDFFERNQGQKRQEIDGMIVESDGYMQGNRWHSVITYRDTNDAIVGGDHMDWQMFTPNEFVALAAECGFTSRLVCTWADKNIPPSPDVARMQVVLERV